MRKIIILPLVLAIGCGDKDAEDTGADTAAQESEE